MVIHEEKNIKNWYMWELIRGQLVGASFAQSREKHSEFSNNYGKHTSTGNDDSHPCERDSSPSLGLYDSKFIRDWEDKGARNW